MPEQIQYAVVASLLNRLGSTASSETGGIYGAEHGALKSLKHSIDLVKAVLLDAEKKQIQSDDVEQWIRRLNGVLHSTDNLLDEFLIENRIVKMEEADKSKVEEADKIKVEEADKIKVEEADKSKVTQVFQVFRLSFPNRIVFRPNMDNMIVLKQIQRQIKPVVKDLRVLKLNRDKNIVLAEKTIGIKREIGSFLLEPDIIGREDNKKEILSLLGQPHEKQNLSLIAIVGIGGLGKTTLAQLVYNDWEVQNLFEKRMWVCVSHKFDVKTIVKTMLESLTESKIGDTLSLENLQNMLCENLTGKRYLLVLDDVWNKNYEIWAQLRTYLMYGAQDSKVVVTTRSNGVARTMGASVSYALCCLNQEESWILLKNIATYGDKTKRMNQTLESIGRKIVERCSGVPLEIRTLGGLLQDKSEEREWMDVLEGMLWESGEHEAVIMHVLHLSYKNLSPQLKQCFAYCSIYPKGWQIEKDELVQLWMAQGYLEFSGEQNLLEDIGNQFVKIFLMKSIFQDAKMDEDGDIHSFKMHHLMHDLAMRVAHNNCFYLDSTKKIPIGSPLHISLEPNAVHLLDSLDGSMLRTLILLSSDEDEELNWDALSVISNFKSLRALKLSYSSLSKLSGSIGNLKHLRYLNLSRCRGLGNLFKSINNIVFLQTLILTPNENVRFSTMAILLLINLRHLHISDWEASKDKNPTKFGNLSMQPNKSMIFSNWLSPLIMTNLVEISLFLCGSFRCLPPLERHPFLKSLHVSFLEELEYVYYEEVLPLTFFPSLESLTFWFCGKLKGWCRMLDDLNHPNSSSHVSLPPFPRLSQLSIIGCQMLTQMPTFPNLGSRLELFDSSVETLEATLNIAASQYQNDSPPLSMLKSLHIDRMSFNVNKTPKEWMQNLTSLQHLQIDWLTCETIQEIGVWFKDNNNYFPSLQTLSIHDCEDLEALPDWICNLQSLTHLSIHDCINLASLPEEMFLLSKLQTLEIIGCPLLIDECKTQTSAIWTKIAHVPKIILK